MNNTHSLSGIKQPPSRNKGLFHSEDPMALSWTMERDIQTSTTSGQRAMWSDCPISSTESACPQTSAKPTSKSEALRSAPPLLRSGSPPAVAATVSRPCARSRSQPLRFLGRVFAYPRWPVRPLASAFDSLSGILNVPPERLLRATYAPPTPVGGRSPARYIEPPVVGVGEARA